MYCAVKTSILYGINSIDVSCEADVSSGMPYFSMVGFLSSDIKESKDRIKTAIKNSNVQFPAKKITVNISPASIKKSGSSFDLPIAIAILGAMGEIPTDNLKDIMFIGEMNLSGDILPVRGVLSCVLNCLKNKISYIFVPEENKNEASIISDVKVIPVNSLKSVINILRNREIDDKLIFNKNNKNNLSNGIEGNNSIEDEKNALSEENEADFSYLRGNPTLKKAIEIAVSGMHNILLIGPPGTGKSYAASLVPSILPKVTLNEKIEISKIYSAAGLFNDNSPLIDKRPFRSPHHSISQFGMLGGGTHPTPGEITLATNGVLFLDEILEFKRSILESLRQPLEEHIISISKSGYSVTFPADFMLIASSNPCPCGYYPNLSKCSCSKNDIERYLSKLSGPILDRIDLTCSVSPIKISSLSDSDEMSSYNMKRNILDAIEIQKKRFYGTSIKYNSKIPSSKINTYCSLKEEVNEYLIKRAKNMDLSIRAYHKILKLSRTIADLNKENEISIKDIDTALRFRDRISIFH